MTKEQLLDSTDAFLFDLDGTVYLDETPIGDVKGTLARDAQLRAERAKAKAAKSKKN